MYPNDIRAIADASCTELSIVIAMLLNGSILYHPEVLFHKYTGDSFVKKHAGDPLTKLYKSNIARIRASLSHGGRFMAMRKRATRPLSIGTILCLWFHLIFFYGILVSYQNLKTTLKGAP